VESVSGPADQPAAFNEMPDRPIGSTRLLQQNRHLADITGLSNVRFAPEACPSESRDPHSAFHPKADSTWKLGHVRNVPPNA
jgi:hypothetical protein